MMQAVKRFQSLKRASREWFRKGNHFFKAEEYKEKEDLQSITKFYNIR